MQSPGNPLLSLLIAALVKGSCVYIVPFEPVIHVNQLEDSKLIAILFANMQRSTVDFELIALIGQNPTRSREPHALQSVTRSKATYCNKSIKSSVLLARLSSAWH